MRTGGTDSINSLVVLEVVLPDTVITVVLKVSHFDQLRTICPWESVSTRSHKALRLSSARSYEFIFE